MTVCQKLADQHANVLSLHSTLCGLIIPIKLIIIIIELIKYYLYLHLCVINLHPTNTIRIYCLPTGVPTDSTRTPSKIVYISAAETIGFLLLFDKAGGLEQKR